MSAECAGVWGVKWVDLSPPPLPLPLSLSLSPSLPPPLPLSLSTCLRVGYVREVHAAPMGQDDAWRGREECVWREGCAWREECVER
jgi:hypothetical protein